ncbi:hypothetical protein [Nocardia sp. NBC_01327]|uniref:hypothetical protein n=1 Tax=Nocardia sp. NBC_01327 TaxID=2903593 RepID=UPI002E1654B3|nr:hypothetical protein OG326_05985 [Nocardia sp. NBC_01327]
MSQGGVEQEPIYFLVKWVTIIFVGTLILLVCLWPYLFGTWVAVNGMATGNPSNARIFVGVLFEIPWAASLLWAFWPAHPQGSDRSEVNVLVPGLASAGATLLLGGAIVAIGQTIRPTTLCRKATDWANSTCETNSHAGVASFAAVIGALLVVVAGVIWKGWHHLKVPAKDHKGDPAALTAAMVFLVIGICVAALMVFMLIGMATNI